MGAMRFGRGGPGGDRGPRGNGSRPNRALSFLGGGSNDEASIDLSALVDQQTLSDEDRAKADPVLTEYERTISESFKKRYDASIKMQQAMDKMMAQSMQANAQGGAGGQR